MANHNDQTIVYVSPPSTSIDVKRFTKTAVKVSILSIAFAIFMIPSLMYWGMKIGDFFGDAKNDLIRSQMPKATFRPDYKFNSP